ncbi:FG-GAP repeat protein [Chitinophagaceae bacterium MMS25-I14]
MKTLVTFLWLSFILFSCQSKSGKEATRKNSELLIDTLLVFSHGDTLHPIPILNGDLENTLRMYSSKNSFEVFYGDWFVKIFSINDAKFGIIGDSLFRIYKLNGNNLQKLSMEKGQVQLQHFIVTDITNDGFNDVVIYYDGGGINYDTKVLVFNATTKKLEHKKCLDLENLEVDSKNHLIKTWEIPHSTFGGNRKALYRNTEDSIELVKEVFCCVKSKSPGETNQAVLIASKMENHNLIRDTIYTSTAKAFRIFNTSLWDTRHDFDKKKFRN